MKNEKEMIEYMELHGIDITTMQKNIGSFTVVVTIERNEDEFMEIEE